MTLIAVLILFPTPSLHAWGLDAALPGGRIDLRSVAPLIGGRRSVSFPSDPSGIDECANGGWDDNDGAGSALDGRVLRAGAGRKARRPADA